MNCICFKHSGINKQCFTAAQFSAKKLEYLSASADVKILLPNQTEYFIQPKAIPKIQQPSKAKWCGGMPVNNV